MMWGDGTYTCTTFDDGGGTSTTTPDFYTHCYPWPEPEIKPLPKWWRWFDVFRVWEEYARHFSEALTVPLVWKPLSAVNLVQRRQWKRRRRLQRR